MTSQAERQYLRLVDKIKDEGHVKTPSKGANIGIVGYTITLPPIEVPLLQGRRIFWKGIVGELKAFIANENTVEGFEKHGCNFWGAWANEDGSLDVDYARLLHDFNGTNQLKRVIKSIKEKPDSRKHVISLWDPSSRALQVPCVLSYQWIVHGGELHMIWTQRSVDVMIGLASDMFSAWLLNQLIARECGLIPGPVIMNLADCHIYVEHVDNTELYIHQYFNETALVKPTANITGNIEDFEIDIIDYYPMPAIKFDLKV
jgi:thymidylate synthase